MACQWLRRHGLSTDEVVFVEVGSSTGVLDALRVGSIDALCNPDPIMHWLEQKNEVRLLGEARTLVATRKLMMGAHTRSLSEQLDQERDAQSAMGQTHDYFEGVKAFLEKRPATFKGE